MHYSSLYHMLPRITAADGKMRAGGSWRFDAERVEARMRAGLFGRGLDEHGKPAVQSKLRAVG
jgi:hypothetical protein